MPLQGIVAAWFDDVYLPWVQAVRRGEARARASPLGRRARRRDRHARPVSAQADPDSPPFASYPCGNVIEQCSGYYNPLQFPVDWPQDRPPPLPPVGAPPLIVMPPGRLLPCPLPAPR